MTGALVAAYLQDRETVRDDSGTTTVMAALAVFFLGGINYYGYRTPAVALGVGITVLLYFKAEIEGFSHKLTGQDVRSMLQFAVLTAVILPLLPDRAFGPYGVLNPFQIWLMVVLVAAVSLSGYVAWRLTLGRHGLVLTGVLGGLVSSTATTLGYARQVAAGSQTLPAAVLVILLANATKLVRVLFLVGVVAPNALPRALVLLVPALLVSLAGVAWRWKAVDTAPANGEEAFRNPTQLGTALGFGAAYALVLLFSAWANDVLGASGVLALAAASGLTDVDAITLSSMQMLNREALSAGNGIDRHGRGRRLQPRVQDGDGVGGRRAGAARSRDAGLRRRSRWAWRPAWPPCTRWHNSAAIPFRVTGERVTNTREARTLDATVRWLPFAWARWQVTISHTCIRREEPCSTEQRIRSRPWTPRSLRPSRTSTVGRNSTSS